MKLKKINITRVRGITPVGDEKGLWRKWFAEEPSLKLRMKDWTSRR